MLVRATHFLYLHGSVALCYCWSCFGCLALCCACGFRPPVKRHRAKLVMKTYQIISHILKSADLDGVMDVVYDVLFWSWG